MPEQHPRLLSLHGSSEERVEGAKGVGSAPVGQTVANRGRASTARCPILVRRTCRIFARGEHESRFLAGTWLLGAGTESVSVAGGWPFGGGAGDPGA